MFSDDQSRRRVSLDISPLLDVVFLLLIFFLVTTTFMPDASMDLELPESTTATQSEIAATVVTVGEDGGVQIDGDSVSMQELERTIAALLPEEREKITVRADARVDYGVIVRIIDALRNAGVDALSLPMDTVQSNAGRER
ncbi:MAG: biopolymer transporter ExbD [Vicinamibacterales bacterium]|jgi:biopolymer transport protein ExbD|nr:biopolymer transporter ExbD [Vicinamibacterales bacterium]MEE2649657.1 biopolymer transporter ExbD [Acidobacteriota bacterium]|tara:strand:+ start:233 stop:652 length:420 start_codon:yes stop_codon:yes gene_type:complete